MNLVVQLWSVFDESGPSVTMYTAEVAEHVEGLG